ncbi:ankyrin-1-like isoform X2 [Coccinella septempunctata]|uniref:ankyrin-1-like isoform X2 n=1 Tax=Coccinella septempunctata TaxID=41139 RepID=UPI001D078537|nr:ankyrin-1-like isoform X2 [Coccinella septempunctata]XP_044765010.1 ankyrin-1-like isoform X2 [Coccinella septempunctata]XP_044765011.1 ankyrin-1-like isoform X2 [Coccinella septempunctata]XP_044765012.1 ankyrin-1-like isoform X2 [Coccinella septempunctata]
MTLLQKGAFVNIHDDYGCTALDMALELGHYQVIRPLVEYGSETFIIMNHLQRPLKWDECLNELIKSGISITKACFGRTLLQNIFRDEPKNIEFIEKLLDLGADINCFDYRKDGLIHSMANSLMEREVGLPLLMVILKRGIQVETLNLREQTPLQLAIINRKEFMMQPLLEYGAIIGDPTYKYPTLLDEAYDRGMFGCLKEMIRHLIVRELRGEFVEEKLEVKMASPLYVKFYRSCFDEIQGLKLEKILNTP